MRKRGRNPVVRMRNKFYARAKREGITPKRVSQAFLKKLVVLERKGCTACSATDALQMDHIQRIAEGGQLYDEHNIQFLCKSCHMLKTREENTKRLKLELAQLEEVLKAKGLLKGTGSWSRKSGKIRTPEHLKQ